MMEGFEEHFKKICSELTQDHEIRFAGYLDSKGNLLAGGYKDVLIPRLSEKKFQTVCKELAGRVETRKNFDDELGNVKYSASRRRNVVIMSFPIFENVLMVIAEPHVNIDRLAFRISGKIGEPYENSLNGKEKS